MATELEEAQPKAQNEAQQSVKIEQISQKIASFIALSEEAAAKLELNQAQTDDQIKAFRAELDKQLQHINQATEEMSEIMTAAGAARWRVAAEQAFKDSEDHNKEFRKLLEDFKGLAREAIVRLEHISVETEKRMAMSLQNLAEEQTEIVDEFRTRAENSYSHIEKVGVNATTELKKALKWFRWDRFASAIIAALVASMLTATYINGEMPWESNLRVSQERSIGQNFIKAWPTLSAAEKDQIKNSLNLQ